MEMKQEDLKDKVSWKSFFRFVVKGKFSWLFIILSIVCGLGSSSVLALIPDSTAQIYEGDFSMSTLGGFFFLTVASFLIAAVTNFLTVFAKARSTRGVRNVVWKKMLRTKASTKEAQEADTLLTAITSDSKLAVNFTIEALIMIPSAIYLIVAVIMMSAELNVKLLWVMFVLVPIYIIYGIFVGRWQEKTNYRMQMKIGKLTGYLSERLYNLDLVKAYTNEAQEKENGREVSEQLYKANMQSYYVNATTTGYVLLTDVIATVIGIAWGSYLLKRGEIGVEAWMSFFVMLPMINEQMRYLVQLWVSAKGVLGYSKRLITIMDAPVEKTEGSAVKDMGTIELQNVSFAYDDKKVVNQVSLTIPKGRFTAVVGTSGSGKTTMLNLIERLYSPLEGTIVMDGTDISTMDLNQYRNHIAYIQQNAGIFGGTIKEAICYGITRQVSDDEVMEAAKKSGILDDILKLSEGINAPVALWGESLSGGQRQKLVIARAILRNADVILLDEPTSSLDVTATKEMHDNLHELFRDKTVVAVTHDLKFAEDADQIVVMNNGAVLQSGTHEELMNCCEFYQNMVAAGRLVEA